MTGRLHKNGKMKRKMKNFLIVAVGLSLALFFTNLVFGTADVESLENFTLTLEEYHDAWVSYLEDRLDYAREQDDERLENAMLWCLEHHTKEEIARWLDEGDLGVRSVAENVIFEWEDEWGGTGRSWVGSAEGKAAVRVDPPPIEPVEDIPTYGLPFASVFGESAEDGDVVNSGGTTSLYGIDFVGGTNLTGWETGFYVPDGLDSPPNVRRWRFLSGWATGEPDEMYDSVVAGATNRKGRDGWELVIWRWYPDGWYTVKRQTVWEWYGEFYEDIYSHGRYSGGKMWCGAWESVLGYSINYNAPPRKLGPQNATDFVTYQDLYSGDWQRGIVIESGTYPPVYTADYWFEVNSPPMVGEIVEWYAGFPTYIRAWVPE